VEGMKELTPEEMGWFLYLLNEFELVDMHLEFTGEKTNHKTNPKEEESGCDSNKFDLGGLWTKNVSVCI
jgi:hypothetical protein